MMNVRNPKYSEHGSVECGVEHPVYGWIPFHAVAGDPESDKVLARIAANALPIAATTPLPLPDIQAKSRAQIIAARNAEITGGFTYQGKPIDSDRDSVMSITGAGVAALAAKLAGLPYSVTWTCADDSTLVLDADGVLGMVVMLAQFADAQHAKARTLKDAIKNAKTPSDVNKVVW